MPNDTVSTNATGLPAAILPCPVAAHAERLAELYAADEWSPELHEIDLSIQRGQATSLEGLLLQALLITDYGESATFIPPHGEWREAHEEHTSAIVSSALNMVRTLVSMGARLPDVIMSQHGFDQDGRDAVGTRTIPFLGSIE